MYVEIFAAVADRSRSEAYLSANIVGNVREWFGRSCNVQA